MRKKFQDPVYAIRLMFFAFCAIALIAVILSALLYPKEDMLAGLVRICTQSGQVPKSYFDASYGGISGTFLNLFLVSLVLLGIYCLPGAKPNGVSVLAFYLTCGFCFWGMTILNIWFTFLGVALYALVKKKPLGTLCNAMLFSTGLAPLITELLFRYPGEGWHPWSIGGTLIALAVGIFIGFILPAGLAHSPKMHKGFDLYSAAVPMGLTAFFLRALLFKVFGGTLADAESVGIEADYFPIAAVFCGMVFGLAILWGLLMGGGKRYGALLRDCGHDVDFSEKYGPAAACLNFGIFGVFIVLYYCAVGATWNAVTLGIVFCMVCTAFKGSHPLNVWPIMLGYVAASCGARLVCSLTGAEFSMAANAQAIVIGLCYANGMSPVSGKYGWFAGFLFAVAHYTLVTCVPLLHGGFLLYNGGFTAAITCFLFIPVLEHFVRAKEN